MRHNVVYQENRFKVSFYIAIQITIHYTLLTNASNFGTFESTEILQMIIQNINLQSKYIM